MNCWYEQRPGLLDKEMQLLKAAGVDYQLDEVLMQHGVIRIRLVIEPTNKNFDLAGRTEPLVLVAVFPDLYPYFRPLVFAPDLELARHQHPFEKNLCLLGRSSFYWDSSSTLVSHLKEQLTKALVKGMVTDAEVIKKDTAEQAEPVSEYYAPPKHVVLMDKSLFDHKELAESTPRFLAAMKLGWNKKIEQNFPRLSVLEIKKINDESKSAAPNVIRRNFSEELSGQMFRVSQRPPARPTETIGWLERLLTKEGSKLELPKTNLQVSPNLSIKSVVALCFDEEQQKGIDGPAWLFHFHLFEKGLPVRKGERHAPGKDWFFYARAADIGNQFKNLRAPRLGPLIKKTAGVIGVGALGSFIALDLARAGIGSMKLMDHDTLDPATIIRWPLGLESAGQYKVSILKKFIDDQYPSCEVKPYTQQVGVWRAGLEGTVFANPEGKVIDDYLEGLSVLIDATTEFGVHHFLSLEARKRGIPYVCVYATAGAHGGSVMRQLSQEKTGCWSCFMHMEADKSLLKLNEDEPSGHIQPPGCGDVTFTGASIDLQQISLAATRMIISTLCADEEDGYPNCEWDIARVNSYDNEGKLLAPRWETFKLPVHKDCFYCNE